MLALAALGVAVVAADFFAGMFVFNSSGMPWGGRVVLAAIQVAGIAVAATLIWTSASRLRREYERAVSEIERNEACLEASGWAHYKIGPDGAMTWSRNASEVLAAGEHLLPNSLQAWLLRVDSASRDAMRRRYQDLLGGRASAAREFTLRHAENSVVACEDIAKSFEAGPGAREVVGVIRNTTAIKAMQEELKQARPVVSVGRIAGTIAHDLANVLSIIHGQSQLLAASAAQASASRFTSAIMAAAERGRQLCHQILFIARPRPLRDDVKAGELMQELHTMLTGLARVGITIQIDVEHGDLALQFNAGRLLQALLNLCINALESMKGGGVLTLRCFHVRNETPFPGALGIVHVGRFVCFELSDTGEGIPQYLLSRIFEPGYSTKQGDAPRGLGLATIASVLAEIGAFLDVESQTAMDTAGTARTPGTTFRVYVPCPASVPDAAIANVLHPAKLGVGESILVMDLDEEKLLRMEDMIANIGYEPKAFSSCEEAIGSVKAHNTYQAAIIASNVTLADGTPFYDAVAEYIPAFKIVLISKSSQGAPTTKMSTLIEPFTHLDLGAVLAKIVSS